MINNTRVSQSLVAAALATALALAGSGVAGAAVYDITLSRTSGPPGTSVTISGANCSPGVTIDPTADYVRIASTLVTAQAPVAADGSWHVTASISGVPAAEGPAPIGAVCVTDNVPSLTTVYAPATFTVTSAGSTPTATPGGGSHGGADGSDPGNGNQRRRDGRGSHRRHRGRERRRPRRGRPRW